MSRIEKLDWQQLMPEQQQALQSAEQMMGFIPNDALIMARQPALMDAFAQLVRAVYAPGNVDAGLKRLIGLMTSSAAGCRYCMSHTAFTSTLNGVSDAKLAAIWEFESSELYSAAERAALRVALHAGQQPNAVSDELFEQLADHYNADSQLEIVAVISLFGFLNRWNQTLATDIESLPAQALSDLS